MLWYRLLARRLHDWRDQGVAFVARLFRRRQPPVEDEPRKINPVANVLAAGLTPPVDTLPEPTTTQAPEPKLNRKERRTISALERARRKHDKFVEPKGEMPPPKPRPERSPHEPRPLAPPPPPINSAEIMIADKHHEDLQGEDVLYKESELWGEFNFRDTILEQLESYFIYIARMKQNDPEAYGLYKEVGAMVVPYSTTGLDRQDNRERKIDGWWSKRHPASEWFSKTRPGFGCLVYGADPVTEKYEKKYQDKKRCVWVPKFLYFTKYKEAPPELQHISGGDIYSLTVYWDRPWDSRYDRRRKGGTPQSYGVFVSADGKSIQVLRQIKTSRIEVPAKNKRRDADGNIHFHQIVPQRCWRIPDVFASWARDEGLDPQLYLANLFVDATTRWEFSNYSMVRIAAEKDGHTAVFGVNVKRLGYFFRDRDIEISQAGVRKKVFHLVRAHERHTRDGKTYYVPFHFRGEREFTWAGYRISITVPARDHVMLAEVDVGSHDEYWITDPSDKKWIHGEKLGQKLKGWIKEGAGKYQP
jgi:hypothetical protein